jgi:very-short-patch-repair endonuclease
LTDAERALWRALREAFPDLHWRKQVPFGPYVADFCTHRAKLIVEVDGSQHASQAFQASDAERSRFLAAEGYRVLRFWNSEVLSNRDGVIATVADRLSPSPSQAAPGPLPLPLGEGCKE